MPSLLSIQRGLCFHITFHPPPAQAQPCPWWAVGAGHRLLILPLGGLLSIPHTAGTDPWLPGHKHLLTHQAEQQWPGALGSCSQVAKKNLNQKCGFFCNTDKGTLL